MNGPVENNSEKRAGLDTHESRDTHESHESHERHAPVSMADLPLSRRRFLPLAAAGLGLASGWPLSREARAQIRVEIDAGVFRPLNVGFVPLEGDLERGELIGSIVRSDLEGSGFFRLIDQSDGSGNPTVDGVPNFDVWRRAQVELLVVGRLSTIGSNLQLDVRLWDVGVGEALAGKRLTTPRSGLRRLAHILADAIYTRLTGEGPYFDSRIAFVDETGSREERAKRIALMDQDGANLTFLTDSSQISLTPQFHPRDYSLAYLALKDRRSEIFLLDLERNRQRSVEVGDSIVFSPRFSPDGDRLLFSRKSGLGVNLFVLDLSSGRVVRLSEGAAIDTAPSYAPDGQSILFESDRGGGPQIYRMDASGGNVRRLTSGRGRYSTPVWSPKGDRIAFTRSSGGVFSIGVMRPDGSGERLLTSGFHNEGPTFSPNGRVVMFFSDQGAGPRLWSVDLSGRHLRRRATPAFASDPSWSPLRPR